MERRPVLVLLVLLAAISLVFLAFPSLDMAASAAFHDGRGFAWALDPTLDLVRDLGRWLTILVCGLAVGSLLFAVFRAWPRWVFRPHQALYLLAVYVVGPGLVVNGIFKSLFGRARPREIVEFGGGLDFTPVWVVSDACVGNCSFVSGEGSAAAALLALLVCLPRGDRLVVAPGLVAVAAVVSFNRVVFGGHFLSDVLIAWVIVLLIAVLLRPLFFGARGETIDRAVLAVAEHVSPRRAALERRLIGTFRAGIGNKGDGRGAHADEIRRSAS